MIALSAIGHGLAYTGLALLEPATPTFAPRELIEISIEPAPARPAIERPAPTESEPGPEAETELAQPQTEYLNGGAFLDMLTELGVKAGEGGKALNVHLASHGVKQKFGQMNADQQEEWNKAVKEALGTS